MVAVGITFADAQPCVDGVRKVLNRLRFDHKVIAPHKLLLYIYICIIFFLLFPIVQFAKLGGGKREARHFIYSMLMINSI